MEPAW